MCPAKRSLMASHTYVPGYIRDFKLYMVYKITCFYSQEMNSVNISMIITLTKLSTQYQRISFGLIFRKNVVGLTYLLALKQSLRTT